MQILVVERGADRECFVDSPFQRAAQRERFLPVGIALILPINPAAIAPVGSADPESEDLVDDGGAKSGAGLVARIAVAGCGQLTSNVPRLPGESGLRRNESDGPSLGTRSKQRPLRATQDLDPVEIKES